MPNVYSSTALFYASAMNTARRVVAGQRHDLKLFTIGDLTERLADHSTHMQSLGFDSLVFFCCDPPDGAISQLIELGVSVAMVRRQTDARGVTMITDDDERGFQLAMQHLHKDRGHTKIALLGRIGHRLYSVARQKSYTRYVKAHGLADDPQLQIDIPQHEDAPGELLGEKLGETLDGLFSGGRMTAIACLDDGMAIEAAKALLERGIRIPEDIAITGYDNDGRASSFHPGITSVNIPVEEMVEAACHSLFNPNPRVSPAQTLLKFDNALVIRQSTDSRQDYVSVKH